jgi:hypothetical protein
MACSADTLTVEQSRDQYFAEWITLPLGPAGQFGYLTCSTRKIASSVVHVSQNKRGPRLSRTGRGPMIRVSLGRPPEASGLRQVVKIVVQASEIVVQTPKYWRSGR